MTGSDNIQGTTISHGLVGHWYFPYGWAGVIEGGLLFGWLLVVGERALVKNLNRPLTISSSPRQP